MTRRSTTSGCTFWCPGVVLRGHGRRHSRPRLNASRPAGQRLATGREEQGTAPMRMIPRSLKGTPAMRDVLRHNRGRRERDTTRQALGAGGSCRRSVDPPRSHAAARAEGKRSGRPRQGGLTAYASRPALRGALGGLHAGGSRQRSSLTRGGGSFWNSCGGLRPSKNATPVRPSRLRDLVDRTRHDPPGGWLRRRVVRRWISPTRGPSLLAVSASR